MQSFSSLNQKLGVTIQFIWYWNVTHLLLWPPQALWFPLFCSPPGLVFSIPRGVPQFLFQAFCVRVSCNPRFVVFPCPKFELFLTGGTAAAQLCAASVWQETIPCNVFIFKHKCSPPCAPLLLPIGVSEATVWPSGGNDDEDDDDDNCSNVPDPGLGADKRACSASGLGTCR